MFCQVLPSLKERATRANKADFLLSKAANRSRRRYSTRISLNAKPAQMAVRKNKPIKFVDITPPKKTWLTKFMDKVRGG